MSGTVDGHVSALAFTPMLATCGPFSSATMTVGLPKLRGPRAGLVTIDEVRAIVGENFLRAYRVDVQSLAGLVDEIGPTAANLGAVPAPAAP
jgi:hypothetical protein